MGTILERAAIEYNIFITEDGAVIEVYSDSEDDVKDINNNEGNIKKRKKETFNKLKREINNKPDGKKMNKV